LLILGAGPAGLTAAIYAARAEMQPVVLTGMQVGGQAALTNLIENYPGFIDGIQGSEISEKFQKQAEKFGARLVVDSVEHIEISKQPFEVQGWNEQLFGRLIDHCHWWKI